MSLFLQEVVEDGYSTYNLTGAGYTLIIALIIAAVIVAGYFINKDGKGAFSIRQIAFSSICMALGYVLSNVKLFHLPMGGAVTLFSMFFITFAGYLYGPRIGFTAAFAYGLFQLIIDPYIISVPQLLCDYILAFGALGLSGFFWKSRFGLVKGYIFGIFGRFVFSTLSGVIFFADYAPEGMSPLAYSVMYNGAYIGAEGLITVVVLMIPAVASAIGYIRNMATEGSEKKAQQSA